MKQDIPFTRGQVFDRVQINELIGGGLVTYLPSKEGRIIAGCFDPKKNRRAPREIDVGRSEDVVSRARALAGAKSTIPVFLKEGTKRWKYIGLYQCTNFSQKEQDIHAYPDRRKDAVGVLYLREVSAEHSEDVPSVELLEFQGLEGRKKLAQHFRRERRADLAIAKRNEIRANYGQLICEACDIREQDFPKSIGEACFEVHHKIPLADLSEEVETRLIDLAMLCANCHRMIHRCNPMPTVAGLRKLLQASD